MSDPKNELAPFVAGEEVRTFGALEFDLLVKHLPGKPIRPRTLKAARLVLVDRVPYRNAAIICNELPSFVRGAVLGTMERFGLTGPLFYAYDPALTAVFRNVPKHLHQRFKREAMAMLARWEKEATGEVFEQAGWGSVGPHRTDLGVLNDSGINAGGQDSGA